MTLSSCRWKRPDSLLTRQTKLLESIPGARFLTAVTIVCEIDDFSAFRCPKKLYSYFGFDPVVRQSGNSTSADLPKEPVLRMYYLEKCKTKAKMTALGAIIHKFCNIIFAVLRDETPFVLISPPEHCQKYSSISQAAGTSAISFFEARWCLYFLYPFYHLNLSQIFRNPLLTFLSWTRDFLHYSEISFLISSHNRASLSSAIRFFNSHSQITMTRHPFSSRVFLLRVSPFDIGSDFGFPIILTRVWQMPALTTVHMSEATIHKYDRAVLAQHNIRLTR